MPDLDLSVDRNIARLRLNRPEVLNALSPALLASIVSSCEDLGKRDDIHVVVLEGAGRGFCAGADLPAFDKNLQSGSHESADLGRRAADAIAELPQITIAAVHGHCVGGAIVLAASCDLRIAADNCRFSIPEVDAGIPLAWGGMGHLFRLIGETRAVELVLSCRPFDADEAARAGFLSSVVPAIRFETEVAAFAGHIASKPAAVLRLVKQQIIALHNGSFDPRSDADALLTAYHDPVARAMGNQYVSKRIRKERQ